MLTSSSSSTASLTTSPFASSSSSSTAVTSSSLPHPIALPVYCLSATRLAEATPCITKVRFVSFHGRQYIINSEEIMCPEEDCAGASEYQGDSESNIIARRYSMYDDHGNIVPARSHAYSLLSDAERAENELCRHRIHRHDLYHRKDSTLSSSSQSSSSMTSDSSSFSLPSSSSLSSSSSSESITSSPNEVIHQVAIKRKKKSQNE